MGILETIIENCNKQIITNKEYTNIFKNKTISKNYETKEKDIVEIFMKCLKEKIKIDKTTRYKNINDKYKDLYKAKEDSDFKYPDQTKSDEDKYTFSATKLLNKSGEEYYYAEPEPTLEKLIKISTNYKNQIPLPEDKSHIDLIKKAGKTIKFVELKQWENPNNTPFWAVAESVVNLYKFIHLYVNITKENDYFKKIFADRYESILKMYDISDTDTFNLIILAPKEYFLEYFSDKNQAKCKIIFYEKFCKKLQKQIEIDLKQTLGKNYKIKFSTKYFDFTKDDFKNLVGYNNDTKYKDSIISTYLRDNNKNLRTKTDNDRYNEKHNRKLYNQDFSEFNTGNIWLGKNLKEKDYEYLINTEYKNKLRKWADYTEAFDIIWEGNIYPRELKNEVFKKFFQDSKFKKLLDVIKSDKELVMCLRGNDNYTTVYYKGLQILKIHLNNNKFEIDKNYGTDFFKNLGIKHDIKGERAFFEIDSDFEWTGYFAESKKQINLHDRQKKTEKEFQQNIYSTNTCSNNEDKTDYIFFDMEYCFIPNKEIYPRKTARFDGLALKWTQDDRIKGKQATLAIIELKVGLGSIKGDASLSCHYNDVSNFVKGIDIDKFISDMENVIRQMNRLGLININENLTKPFIDRNNLQFICVIKDYNEKSKQLNDELNEITICKKDNFSTLFKLIDNDNYKLFESDLLRKDEILK